MTEKFEDDGKVGAVRAESEACGTEIEQLHAVIAGQEDIVWTDVAMDQSLGMAGAQRVGDRNEQFESNRTLETALGGCVLFERAAVEIFHDHVAGAVLGEKVEN